MATGSKKKTATKKPSDYTPDELGYLSTSDPVEKRAAWIANTISEWHYDSLEDFIEGIEIIVRVRKTGDTVMVVPPAIEDWDE